MNMKSPHLHTGIVNVQGAQFTHPSEKELQRQRIEADYQAFLAKGRKPKLCKRGETGIEEKPRKGKTSAQRHFDSKKRQAEAEKTFVQINQEVA